MAGALALDLERVNAARQRPWPHCVACGELFKPGGPDESDSRPDELCSTCEVRRLLELCERLRQARGRKARHRVLKKIERLARGQ
jgi:hypothetical protein